MWCLALSGALKIKVRWRYLWVETMFFLADLFDGPVVLPNS
jgi:hypothetical protein